MGRRRRDLVTAPPGGPAWQRWTRRAVVGLSILVSAWWVYDGLRALLIGDYVTPRSGPYAGELGPWAHIVEAVGIDPRGTGMKATFVTVGLSWFILAAAYLQRPWLWRWLILFGVFALWYVPVGTIAGPLIVAGLIVLHPLTESRARRRMEERRKAGP